LREFLDEIAGLLEVMAREPGKEVMGDLQVQSAMQEFDKWVTDNVSCGAELSMRKRLRWTEINSGARVVRKDDLDVQRARNNVAHKEIHQTCLPRAASTENVRVPGEEAKEGEHLKPPSPTSTTSFTGLIAGDPEVAV